MTPDLDARVAEEIRWLEGLERTAAGLYRVRAREQLALIRDLHAALQAREGGEECWAVVKDGDPITEALALSPGKDDAEAHAAVLNDSFAADGYSVRRLRCRVVEGE